MSEPGMANHTHRQIEGGTGVRYTGPTGSRSSQTWAYVNTRHRLAAAKDNRCDGTSSLISLCCVPLVAHARVPRYPHTPCQHTPKSNTRNRIPMYQAVLRQP
eukprot:3937028-Rhodomonas_salina.1